MENDYRFDGSVLRGKAFLRLLTCLPLLALPVLPIYAYLARPDDLTLFTWLLAVEAGLCLIGFMLLGIKWRGQGGSGKNNGGATVLTEKSLYYYLGKSRIKSFARCALVLALVLSVAALISLRTESADAGEITVVGWVAFGISILILVFMAAAALAALTPVKSFILTLSKVTYTEEVEHREPGNDGTTTYDHYIYFGAAKVPREKRVSVSGLEYLSVSTGDLYYLLIVNGQIAGRFDAQSYEPDEKLKEKLVDETEVTPEEFAEAKDKKELENMVLNAIVRGDLPKLEPGVSHTNILDEKPTLEDELSAPSAQRESAWSYPGEYEDFLIRPRVVRIIVSVLAAGMLISCLFIFLPYYARLWWPASLLPLLVAFRPIKELIDYRRDEKNMYGVHHITRDDFIKSDVRKMVNYAVVLLCIFLAVWWAAHCFVRTEDDPGLWGPLFFFVYPPGIAALILFILVPIKLKKGRKKLERHEVTIIELPIIRKEARNLRSSPDCYFWFPDVDRGDKRSISSNASVVFENGRIKVNVSRAEFDSANEGDLYTILLDKNANSTMGVAIRGMYPSRSSVVEADMTNYIGQLKVSEMREDDQHIR